MSPICGKRVVASAPEKVAARQLVGRSGPNRWPRFGALWIGLRIICMTVRAPSSRLQARRLALARLQVTAALDEGDQLDWSGRHLRRRPPPTLPECLTSQEGSQVCTFQRRTGNCTFYKAADLDSKCNSELGSCVVVGKGSAQLVRLWPVAAEVVAMHARRTAPLFPPPPPHA